MSRAAGGAPAPGHRGSPPPAPTPVTSTSSPPRLFVFGTGHDAVPVVELARVIGWETIVCAPQPRPILRERFGRADRLIFGAPSDLAMAIDVSDRAIVVIMAHDYQLDRDH